MKKMMHESLERSTWNKLWDEAFLAIEENKRDIFRQWSYYLFGF